MLKKILCLIVAVVMSCSVLAGCNLVTFDTERDGRKVAITVSSYDIVSPDGTQTYTTKEKKIYKSSLQSVYSYYGAYYEYYYGKDKAKELIVEELATERIVLNLADAYIQFGYISLGNYEKNQINQNVYAALDSVIESSKTAILEERGIVSDSSSEDEDDDEQSTTYPVKDSSSDAYDGMDRNTLVEICRERGLIDTPAKGDDAAQDAIDKITVRQLKNLIVQDDRKDIELWTPSLSKYPGLNTYDEETRSLELEAFSRALKSIKESVLGLYDLTDEDKTAIEADYKKFEEIENKQGLSYVYGALRDSHTAYLYAGESYESQQKLSVLEEYITGTVEVTRSDVESIYQRTLAEQIKSFADTSSYETALNGDDDILYFADSNHFFVKHILVPFSDAQTAQLTAYKSSVENVIEGNYEDFRNRLANEIMSYEHVDGEDYGDPIGINKIYTEVEGKVNAAATLYEKERAFDDLIYKYNTDPGIFDKTYGYMELYDLGDSTETYMQEFADAARALYEGGVEGAISGMVVTDYGVHILYLSKLPKAGEIISLDGYYSYGAYQTVYGKMEEEALSEKEEAAYSKWREEQIARYYKGDSANASVVIVNNEVVDSISA